MSFAVDLLEQRSDLELIEIFQAGDQAAFEAIVSRYRDRVFSLATRLTRNPEDSEEVLQDVFVTVYRKIGGFEGKASFSSWLYRVTVNAALMKLRKRRQDTSVPLEDALPQVQSSLAQRSHDQHDCDRMALRSQITQALEDAIRELPDEYRPVFVLRDIDGLTSREVSKMLDLSIPAVKSRLHRSRLMLRRSLCSLYHEYLTGKVHDQPLSKGA